MSDETFNFCFSEAHQEHFGLDRASATYLADTLINHERSRVRAISALAAARSLIAHDIAPGTKPETNEALCALIKELELVEYALRDLEDGIKPSGLTTPTHGAGRQPESSAVIDFQVRAVLAVNWMQHLDSGSLEKSAAVSAVAKVIPRTLLKSSFGREGRKRGETLEPEEQIAAWIDKSSRQGTRQHGRLLELWFEINSDRQLPLSRDTSLQVISWLKTERTRLFGS